jgi:hypothetical protein
MNVTIKRELQALKRNGVIVPETVLEWARQHTRSALHRAINWDPAYNVNAHLLHQVRSLITLHIRTIDRKPGAVSLSIDRTAKGGYREVDEVMSSAQLRRVMLEDALHEVELLQQRFAELHELELIWSAAARVREQIMQPPRRPPGSGRGRGGEARPSA